MLAQRTRDQTFQKPQLKPYGVRRASSILLTVFFFFILAPPPSSSTAGEAQDVPLAEIGCCDVVGIEEEDYSCRLQGWEICRIGGVGRGSVVEEGGAGLEEEGYQEGFWDADCGGFVQDGGGVSRREDFDFCY